METVVHFHAEWEAQQLLNILNYLGADTTGRSPSVNRAEANHIANHIARTIDPDGWRALVNNPDA